MLVSVCAFLFVINVVLGTYLFVTTQRVDRNAAAVKLSFCIQTDAYRGALAREQKLAITDVTKAKRKAHRVSAEQLKNYLEKIEPVAHCSRPHRRDHSHKR